LKKVLLVAGTISDFMKIAHILRPLERHNDIEAILVHTGWHSDQNMSGTFFKELGIREPDFHLDVGAGSHAVQAAEIMKEFEKVHLKHNPNNIVV